MNKAHINSLQGDCVDCGMTANQQIGYPRCNADYSDAADNPDAPLYCDVCKADTLSDANGDCVRCGK